MHIEQKKNMEEPILKGGEKGGDDFCYLSALKVGFKT